MNAPPHKPHSFGWRRAATSGAALPAGRLPAPAPAPASAWLLLATAALLAVFTGLVASTASPIVVGLFVGLLLGVPLLLVPLFSLWIVLAGTLVIGGMIAQFLPVLNKANWLFSMLGFLLLVRAFGTWMVRPAALSAAVPWWAWLALLLPFYAMAVAAINQVAIVEFMAGFKRYFQFWGVFAALILLAVPALTLRRVLTFLVAISLVQVLFAAYQRVVVVPKRVGMGGGVVPIDAVSGTFESSFLGGGSSSVLVFFLLVMFAFVLRLWLDGRLKGWRALLASLLILSPLALGETKAVVVFLPTTLLCALLLDIRRRPTRTVLLLLLGLVATAALAMLYLAISTRAGESLHTAFDKILAYNFGNVGYHSASNLNRSTVFSFWWSQQHLGDPLGLLFGHGPGASHLGDGALVPGHLALRYGGLAIGFTTFSSLLWDFGLLGFAAFLVFNIAAVLAVARAAFRVDQGVWRSVAVAVLAGLLMNLMLCFLGNSATTLASHSTLYMLLLGAAVLILRRAGSSRDARTA